MQRSAIMRAVRVELLSGGGRSFNVGDYDSLLELITTVIDAGEVACVYRLDRLTKKGLGNDDPEKEKRRRAPPQAKR